MDMNKDLAKLYPIISVQTICSDLLEGNPTELGINCNAMASGTGAFFLTSFPKTWKVAKYSKKTYYINIRILLKKTERNVTENCSFIIINYIVKNTSEMRRATIFINATVDRKLASATSS